MYKFKQSINITLIAFICFITIFSQTVNSSADTTAPETFTGNIYHVHTGSESSGGGCYSVHTTKEFTYENQCPGTMIYYPEYDATQCSVCGAGYSGDQSGRRCWYTNPETVVTDWYELGCGKSTSSVMGTFSVTPSKSDWCTEETLSFAISDSSLARQGDSYILNGSVISGNSCVINSSGTYTASVKTVGGTSPQTISFNISNIDVTPPEIRSVNISPKEWTNGSVTASITDVVDIQPDQTAGSGLASMPFSYDGGNTWTDNNSYICNANSEYTFMVRDNMGNIGSKTFSVNNIDTTAPTITSVTYDSTPNIPTTTITVIVEDLQPDNTPGSGIPAEPYSYDNGETWTADNTTTVDQNGTVIIKVRDSFDNIEEISLEISNIDCYGPKISHSVSPSQATDDKVTVTWSAVDIGMEGTDGVGLPADCFSFDNGKTWTDKNTSVVYSNQVIHILARDNLGNISNGSCEITNIYEPSDENDSEDDNSNGSVIITPQKPTPAVLEAISPKPSRKPVKPSGGDKVSLITQSGIVKKPTPTASIVRFEEQETKDEPQIIPTVEIANESSDSTLLKILLTVLGTLAALGLLTFLIFLLIGCVGIYNYEGESKYRFKGFAMIHFRNDEYELNIKEKYTDSCKTNRLKLTFPHLFVAFHSDTTVHIYTAEGKSITTPPYRTVTINI